MATEKRLISLDEAINATHEEVFWTESEAAAVRSFLAKRPKVDAVEVDKYNIKLHHILIDNEGVPKVKLQIGDRYFILHTDPVDVVEVVRCKDCTHYDNSEGICWCHLNSKFYPGGMDWHSFPEDGFCSYGERRTDA